jgi:hypothetical protein
MDAAGQVPQFGQGLGGLARRRVEQFPHLRVRITQVRPSQADGQTQGDQPLLGTVVQVAFELAPGRVGGLHDAGPRLLHLGQLCPDLGSHPRVVQRDPGGGHHHLEQLGLVAQLGVDHHHPVRPGPQGDRDAPRRQRGRVDLGAVDVPVAGLAVLAQGQPDLVVTDGVPQRSLQCGRGRSWVQPHQRLADRGAGGGRPA